MSTATREREQRALFTERLMISMPTELRSRIEKIAARELSTVTDWVRRKLLAAVNEDMPVRPAEHR